MANPFYVQPMGGINLSQGIMDGLRMGQQRELIDQRQQALAQREAAAAQEAAVRQQIADAYHSGDEARMRELVVTYPDLAKGLSDAMAFNSDESRKMMQGAWAAAYENPEKSAEILEAVIAQGESAGLDMRHSRADLEKIQAGEITPEGAKAIAGMRLLTTGAVDTYNRLQDSPTTEEKKYNFWQKMPEGETKTAFGKKHGFLDDQGGALTSAQVANNAEIDAARRRLKNMDRNEVLRLSRKATDTGRTNPDYDPGIGRLVSAATQRKVGEDTEFEEYHSKFYGVGGGNEPRPASENDAKIQAILQANPGWDADKARRYLEYLNKQ